MLLSVLLGASDLRAGGRVWHGFRSAVNGSAHERDRFHARSGICRYRGGICYALPGTAGGI
eukprot:3067288-Rhodomonas_salina.4